MLQEFQDYIQKEKLWNNSGKVLLAVSGGIDSVVMCELFHQSEYKFEIAHCNFKLRGKESDEDEKFVKQLAQKYHVSFYAKSFHTKTFSEKSGVSIQMAARQLRYQWFEELCNKKGFRTVAVAHHKGDVVETLLINLLRGTGISGLHGILPRQGHIIRPLLFSDRNDIEKFAKAYQLPFREDSSNQSVKYLRNKLRKQVIPVLKEINPDLEKTIIGTIEKIKDAEIIFRDTIKKEKEKTILIQNNGERILIPIKKLIHLHPLKTYLFEFLTEYHFSSTVVEDMIRSLEGTSGKLFYSPTHCILKDRENLVITKNKIKNDGVYSIAKKKNEIAIPIKLSFSCKPVDEKFEIPKTATMACLDIDLLKFPLQLRKWKAGDFFHPLGMKAKKKISDFLIDNKVSLVDKENVWVLVSGNEIVWVVSYRIDDRYKITKKTKKMYCVTIK